MSGGRPLAVAVIRHRRTGGERAYRRARAAVEKYATAEGYAVTELFEVFGTASIDAGAVDVLVELADRVDAGTVLTFGDIGEENRRHIIVEAGLRILLVPEPPAPVTSPSGLPVAPAPPDQAALDGGAPQWTGRLDLDLINIRGWWVATLDVVIRLDNLTLWLGDRTLAVIDRDQFRRWLHRPRRLLQIDDVLWSMQDAILWIRVDGSIPYAIAAETLHFFLTTI